jgi:hypothetical protein
MAIVSLIKVDWLTLNPVIMVHVPVVSMITWYIHGFESTVARSSRGKNKMIVVLVSWNILMFFTTSSLSDPLE